MFELELVQKDAIPVKVTKFFEFEACHKLDNNYSGPCERLHGHSYKLYVTVEGISSKEVGMVIDFKVLKNIVNEIVIEKVDHYTLNEVMVTEFNMSSDQNTTCENMLIAFWVALDHEIAERAEGVKLVALKLYETSGSYAELDRKMVYGGME